MKRILVIDDDGRLLNAIIAALQGAGYEAMPAASGELGLKLAQSTLPDLVISDVNLGRMDGFKVLEDLRANAVTTAIPVILMTGGETIQRQGMDSGADDFLPKPFTMVELLAAVRARLERQTRLQAHAKENEARFLEILSATHDFVAIAAADTGHLLYLNPAGRTMLALGADEDAARVRLADFYAGNLDALPAGETGDWVGESEFVSRTGRRIPVSLQILAHKATDSRRAYLSIAARDLTERVAAEKALRESENLYRGLIQSQGEGFVIMDQEFTFTLANPAAEMIFGVQSGRLLGRNLREFLTAQGALTLAAQREARKAGKRGSYELEVRLHHGELRQLLVTGTPKFGADGEFAGTYAVFRDITERKRAEEDRRVLTSALEAAANGVVITDRQGSIQWVNPAFTQLTGYSAAEAVGRKPSVLKSGTHSPEFYARLWQTITRGEVWHGELRNRRKDGQTYEEEMTITPVRDEAGAIAHFVAIKRDISQRKEFERALEQERDLLGALMDHLPDYIYFKDPQSRFTRINRAHARLLGLNHPSEAVGKSDADFFSTRFARQTLVDERRILATGEPVLGVLEEIHTADGKQLWLSVTKVALRDRQGAITGLVGVSRDMSEHKHAEQERQLMELQLRQAQKLEAIGQLAAGIAHEINTPTQYVGDNTRFLKDSFGNLVSVLQAYRELLDGVKQGALTPQHVAKVEGAIAAGDLDYLFEQIPAAISETLEGVERVTKIVRAMKEFSHPGGKEKAASDLNQAIETTITVARNEWKYVADLELDLAPDLPAVPCFLGEFNQCILNLVVNAAHAIGEVVQQAPGSKGRICIRTRRDGEHVEVRVSDTGTGIPEALRPRIFEPFFTTKEVGKGTGQGLSLIYATIVRKHAGEVRFETETGRGTTFILRLPLVARLNVAAPSDVPKFAAPAGPNPLAAVTPVR